MSEEREPVDPTAAPENHWTRWVDPTAEDYVPPQRCFPVSCPPFEDVTLEIAGSAPIGHEPVDGFTADQHVGPVSRCPLCQDFTRTQELLRGFRLEHTALLVTGVAEPPRPLG